MGTFEKGERVGIRSQSLEAVARFGLMRYGTVQRMMAGDQFVIIDLDRPGDTFFGAVMVSVNRVERITDEPD